MGTDVLARALARDFRQAVVEPHDRAMLEYAYKLTNHPHAISDEDVSGLRRAGFSDGAILDICQIVAYYNYVNRLADGLGVEMEATWSDAELTLPRAEFDRTRTPSAEGTES